MINASKRGSPAVVGPIQSLDAIGVGGGWSRSIRVSSQARRRLRLYSVDVCVRRRRRLSDHRRHIEVQQCSVAFQPVGVLAHIANCLDASGQVGLRSR